MIYRLWFTDVADEPMTLIGLKYLRDDPGPDLWADTTTLRLKLLRGHVPADVAAECLAMGTIRLTRHEFVRMLRSIKATGSNQLRTRTRFGTYFVGNLWQVYGPDPDPDE
jgi:cholesterol oxidase